MHTIQIHTIRYFLLPLLLFLFSTGSLFAQSGLDGSEGSEGPTGAPTFNHMTEKIHSSSMNTSQSTTTYFDGLGREVQTRTGYPHRPDIVTFTGV